MDIRLRDTSKTALRAMMKSDKLSKVIKNGIGAPVGSTARKHAQQILRIVKRNETLDGSGGLENRGFTRGQIPDIEQSTPPLQNFNKIRIFNSPAKVRIPFGQKAPKPVVDPDKGILDEAQRQGIPMPVSPVPAPAVDGVGGAYSDVDLDTLPKNVLDSQPGLVSRMVTGLKNLFSPKTSTSGLSVLGSSSAPAENFLSANNKSLLPSINDFSTLSSTVSSPNTPPGALTSPLTPPGPALTVSGAPGTGVGQALSPTVSGTSDVINKEGVGTDEAPAVVPGPTGPTGPSGLAKQYPGVQSAVDSKIGSSMFAIQSLNDIDYLKTLPGFSALSDETLSGGASLQERLSAVQDATRAEFQLDEKLGQLTGLVNQGVGLEGRLTDYIRGRDQFLNETNDMLEEFKDKMLTMNLADPMVRNSAKQYTDYLYTLRGRQNKRYIEFLNMSITEYNGKLEASQNIYNNAVASYERRLSANQAIATEEYTILYNGLSELYNSVAGEPIRQLELQILKAQLYSTQLNNISDALGQTNNDIYSQPYLDAVSNLEDVHVINKSDGTLNPGLSVDDFSMWENNNVASMSNLMQALINSTRKTMQPNEDGPRSPSEIQKIGAQTLNLITQLEVRGILTPDLARNYRSNISSSMGTQLKSGGGYGPDKAEGIRGAVNYLAGTDGRIFQGSDNSWLPFDTGGAPTRSDFEARAERMRWELDSAIINALYTDFSGEAYQKNRKAFAELYLFDQNDMGQMVSTSDEDLVNKVIDNITEKLSTAPVSVPI